MRKTLLLLSHLGAGSSVLFDALSQNPRIEGYRTGQTYDHPEKLTSLTTNIHKRDNSSAIYMDELLFNKDISCKLICSFSKFIFLIREPGASLAEIKRLYPEYTDINAQRYYCYRLRGIYEYICRVPEAVVLTWDDIKSNNFCVLERYLSLKESISIKEPIDCNDSIYSAECLDCYERYLNHIKRYQSLSSSHFEKKNRYDQQ